MTREQWLNAVAKGLGPTFEKNGAPLPPFRVSIGFPSTGHRGKRVAECHSAASSADNHHEIYIRPDQAEPIEVAATLAHELVHAGVGLKHGHDRTFRRVALAIGLEGPMRSTHAGAAFKELAAGIIEQVGAFPHAELVVNQRSFLSDAPKKQSTRYLKAECPECGYTVRLSRMWLSWGAPICPLDKLSMVTELENG